VRLYKESTKKELTIIMRYLICTEQSTTRCKRRKMSTTRC